MHKNTEELYDLFHLENSDLLFYYAYEELCRRADFDADGLPRYCDKDTFGYYKTAAEAYSLIVEHIEHIRESLAGDPQGADSSVRRIEQKAGMRGDLSSQKAIAYAEKLKKRSGEHVSCA